MMNKGNLIIVLFILLFFLVEPFMYLDKECSFLGRSLLVDNKILASYGIKPSLYIRCNSFFQIKYSNGVYYSDIPHPECIGSPVVFDKTIVSYIISDSHIYICERDESGDLFFKELKRIQENYVTQIEEIDIDKDQIIIDASSKLVKIDVSYCGKLIAARDFCFYSIIIVICLILYTLICFIRAIYKMKKNEYASQEKR